MVKRIVASLTLFCLVFTSLSCTMPLKISDVMKNKLGKKSAAPQLEEVKLTTLAVRDLPDGAEGLTSKVTVKAKRNNTNKIRVGFIEDEVAGTGLLWRSAGWMAATVGTLTLGRYLSDYDFTFEITGYIDGPSAGGYMTCGVLACLLGDKLNKDTVMTGTINPDGTIGPVAGIPHKVEAAKKAKKKLVLIPTGCRTDFDLNKQEMVDVIDYGEELGIEVREVDDIFEAYKALTTKEIPQPKGISKKEPELPKKSFTEIKAQVKEWLGYYLAEKGKFEGIASEYQTETGLSYMDTAASTADIAEQQLADGLVSTAYECAWLAAYNASLAYQYAKALEQYYTIGLSESSANLENLLSTAETRMDGVVADLKVQTPETLGDVATMAEAYGLVAEFTGLNLKVNSLIESFNETDLNEDEAWDALWSATRYTTLLTLIPQLAEDTMDIGMGLGKDQKPDKKKVKQLAEVFRKAADANLNYFNEGVLSEIANSSGVNIEALKNQFLEQDLSYLFATVSLYNMKSVQKKAGKNKDLAALGSALDSYYNSAGLITKYYSLAAEVDEEETVTAVRSEKALQSMLDVAEKNAEENLNWARQAKAEPVLGIYYYDVGKMEREGYLDDKLSALNDFWFASTYGKVLAILGGAELQR